MADPMTFRRLPGSRLLLAQLAMLLMATGHAQTIPGNWVEVGPGPAYNGQVEGITNREVTGAINAVAPHPTNASILYVGAVNGGVWRSTNATAASPSWTRLTDSLGSLSIGSLEFDPTDANHQTLLAGVARTSSYGSRGGALIGLLRTSNGGTSWSVLTGGVLSGRAVVGVAGRGATIVVATDQGIYRSTNTGGVFTQISGAAGSGIPAGSTSDLASTPGDNARLYTAVLSGTGRGIYRSTNTGQTWAKVSDTTVDAVMTAGANGSRRTEIAVGQSGQVFLAIVDTSGRLGEVFRSADGATGWTALGVPTTAEQNGVLFGIHPGGQGSLHLSVSADPTDSNIVYVGGDRQPYFGEGVSGSNQFFPNSLGAQDYSGRLFRGNASAAPGSRWSSITHSGAAGNSSPHADSRDMAFDAAGNLIQTDDGGVYKRVSPRTGTGAWFSLNGDMQTTEYHGIAYDAVSDRVIGGAQDTGTTEQRDTSTRIFNSVSTGDGGDPVVEDRSSTTVSTRYSSFQNLQSLRRRTVNASNVVTSTAFPPRTLLNGSPALVAQFYTPLSVNYVSGTRLLIGASNGLYESFDRADSIDQISTQRVNASVGDPLEYGVTGNPELIYFGAGNNLFLRTSAGGTITQINSLAASVVDVSIDPDAPARLFAMTSSTLHYSTNSGGSFSNITGNLTTAFSPGTLRTMAFIPANPDALVVGTDRGIYIAFDSSNFSVWSALGTGLPNAPVFEIEYDRTDNLLVAGTLGRGAWRLPQPAQGDTLFQDGFE